jgi:hypothetical protein
LRRMDVREVDPALTSVARQSLLSAYRYQRSASGVPSLSLKVTRFPDAAVLAAIAERAVATTLVTSTGRALTEVTLWLRNRAQPFMKVSLPPGASMLSVDIAGSPAKPAEGVDGMRVPLLRPGFRPEGPYTVSFVYLHAGAAFAKKGEMQMTLPRMDVPVSVVEWELFLPDQYRADRFTGTAMAAYLVADSSSASTAVTDLAAIGVGGAVAGQIAGRALDATGSVIPGATIVAEVSGQRRTAVTGADGRYVISDLPAGQLSVSSQLPGFKTAQRTLAYDQRPRQIDFQMAVGGVEETVNVAADAPLIDMRSSSIGIVINSMTAANNNTRSRDDVSRRAALEQRAQEPSVNVQSLQRRAAGVLPVRIDIPRAGTSHRFLKPLVVDEETMVQFRYQRR